MKVEKLSVNGALLLTPNVFNDDRGYFKEVYSDTRYADAGIADTFRQMNVSSSKSHVLRGLHGDSHMSKLIQVVRGRAFDVAVDIRRQSSTFMRWCAVELAAERHQQIYVPAGCLHGFLALDDDTMLLYQQSAVYDPKTEIGVAWNDRDIGIEWPLEGQLPLLSAKDALNPTLRELGYL